MWPVTMCTGDCARCRIARSVRVSRSPSADDIAAGDSVEPPVAPPSVAVADDVAVDETVDALVPPTELVLAEAPATETYLVKNTRKGMVGKLFGG